MKKLILLILMFVSSFIIAQSKATGVISLQPNMTADFILDNTTSKVTLILTGPSDRWFGIGIGVASGFGMSAGDVLVYATASSVTTLTDRKFGGLLNPTIDVSQDWTLVSDILVGTTSRTLTLTRNLTNSDATGSDFQMPYGTTNSFSIVGVRASSATFNVGSHGGSSSAGYAIATFTTLGTEDFSLRASAIYPNPSNGTFRIQTETDLTKVNVYGQTGNFIKTIEVKDNSQDVEVNLKGVAKGIYLLELQNETDKSWKKIVVE